MLCTNGIAFAADELGGNLYTNFALLALIGIPGFILSAFVSKRVGRKQATLIPLFLSGVSCLGIALVPHRIGYIPFRVTLGLFGRFFNAMVETGLYVWSNEMFPTHMRSKGMFGVVVVGRFGTLAGSWVIQGLTPYGIYVPFVVLGVCSVMASLFGLLLPETKKKMKLDNEIETIF